MVRNKNTKQCTKCNCFISGDFTMCSNCYRRYTRNTKKNNTTDYQDFVNINSSPEIREYYRIGDIWSNEIRCTECQDVVRSINQHDKRHCKCRKSSIDGGSWRIRKDGPCESIITPFKNIRTNANV